jgi:glycogen debranching enzyme
MGLAGLAELRADHGFDASDSESGLYPALYGRDSLWVVLLLAEAARRWPDDRVDALLATAAPEALTSLARLQGTRVDDLVEEQPGRIPHEYHPSPTPHAVDMALPLSGGRSFAGFDETFLFLLAYDAFAAARPGHAALDRLAPHAEAAFGWVDRYADPDGDGLYEYARRNPDNLLNQVWKDSYDSATHTGFDVPPQPLAWLEVQAYAHAVLSLDPVRRERGDPDRLAALVDERFWLGDDDGFAMALDGRKRPVRMVASNPGHALWAGIVLPHRVDPLVRRLTRPDLLSRYGMRTLSRESPFYAPFAYHRGAVWPFDNAVLGLGLLRYGKVDEALTVAEAVARAMAETGTPVECYAVVEPEEVVSTSVTAPLLCWRHWPVRNRVQAFTAAALVVLGGLLGEARR